MLAKNRIRKFNIRAVYDNERLGKNQSIFYRASTLKSERSIKMSKRHEETIEEIQMANYQKFSNL